MYESDENDLWIGGGDHRGEEGYRRSKHVHDDEKAEAEAWYVAPFFLLMFLLLLCSGSLSRSAFPPQSAPFCPIPLHPVIPSLHCGKALLSNGESGGLCLHRTQPVRVHRANRCFQHSVLTALITKEVSQEIPFSPDPERYVWHSLPFEGVRLSGGRRNKHLLDGHF